MYVLHIANKNYSSWSLRVWVLMKQLSIPFEERLTPFGAGSNWTEFRQFSPTGLVPCLVDGEQNVWDSLGITEYLAEQYSEVWPSDSSARTWARCATAEMHSGFNHLRDICPMNCGIQVSLTDVSDELKRDLSRIDELWVEGLTRFGGPFLAGDKFTAVDAFFAPVVFRANTYAFNLSEQSARYIEYMLSTDAMKTWMAAALLEPWREPSHEQDSIKYGVLIEDNRSV